MAYMYPMVYISLLTVITAAIRYALTKLDMAVEIRIQCLLNIQILVKNELRAANVEHA